MAARHVASERRSNIDIVGMLARYSHIRMNVKGRAFKEACTSKPCPP
jgi:hypothetical protein